MSVDEFANRISALGVPETFRGAESKFQRGTYSLAYFLLLLHAANSEFPKEWAKLLTRTSHGKPLLAMSSSMN
ncbi:hypothetical protein AWV80_05315 [Cupriavidus sp. UYMU48A]|nr:hypothetical protein AWV80_05315 [Cupriavidus sp. UYMU48A]